MTNLKEDQEDKSVFAYSLMEHIPTELKATAIEGIVLKILLHNALKNMKRFNSHVSQRRPV